MADLTNGQYDGYKAGIHIAQLEWRQRMRKVFKKKNVPQNSENRSIATASPYEVEALIHENTYIPPVVFIQGCGNILTDRANSREMVLDCVRSLEESGLTSSDIDTILKVNGLWRFVADDRGLVKESYLSAELPAANQITTKSWTTKYTDATLKVVQNELEKVSRRNEIYKNLDDYYLSGHSLSEGKSYGLGGSPKTEFEIDCVNDWYK